MSGLTKNLVQTIPLHLGTVPFFDDVPTNGQSMLGAYAPHPTMPVPAGQPEASGNIFANVYPPLPSAMPQPYAGHSSLPAQAPPYPSHPSLVPPPQYDQSLIYQTPFNRNSISNASVRSDSFVQPPSAPPIEFGSPNSTRSSICSQQVWDTPPSYEQVYNGPPVGASPHGVAPKRMAQQQFS